MSHKLTDGGQVMHVGTLARVEGEGAMHIEYRDGEVTDVQLRIYEPPRFYEAFLRGRVVHRAAGHHRADLRHLPGRLPDERVLGHRGRLRRRGDRGDPADAPPALLRGVDREPRAAHLPAARPRLPRLRRGHRDGRRPPRGRRAGPADEEGRQRPHGHRSAAARSTRSTSGSAASTGCPTRRAPCAAVPARAGPRRRASRRCAWSRGSTSPTWSSPTSTSRCAPRRATRSSPAAW